MWLKLIMSVITLMKLIEVEKNNNDDNANNKDEKNDYKSSIFFNF